MEHPYNVGGLQGEQALNDRIFRILTVKIHGVQTGDVIPILDGWVTRRDGFHYISSTNVNNAAIALESPEYYAVLERADLSLPDGVPFLWIGRRRGLRLPMRCGIEEVMEAVFETSLSGSSCTHFFYGNTPEVLANLEQNLMRRYPDLKIVGMFSPPFRELTLEEDRAHIRMINESNADFLWVSLGCPKQEQWLYDHRDVLTVPVAGGAGAVFNFFSGDTQSAPAVIRTMGMEWLFRLASEPRRLFTRYCVRYPKFAVRYLLHTLRVWTMN